MPNEMTVAELANGTTILIAHAGRPLPSEEELKRTIGVPEKGTLDMSILKPISKSKARPATADEKVAARVRSQQDEASTGDLAALKARVAELEARSAPPAPPAEPPAPPKK